VRGHVPRPLAGVFGVAGVLGGLSFATALGILLADEGELGADGWALVIGAAGLLCLTLATVVVLAIRRASADARASAALAGPYAAMLLFCIIAYRDDAEVGWYLALAPAAAALAELLVMSVRAFRRTPAALPSG
jgi:hypothetical protein